MFSYLPYNVAIVRICKTKQQYKDVWTCNKWYVPVSYVSPLLFAVTLIIYGAKDLLQNRINFVL